MPGDSSTYLIGVICMPDDSSTYLIIVYM